MQMTVAMRSASTIHPHCMEVHKYRGAFGDVHRELLHRLQILAAECKSPVEGRGFLRGGSAELDTGTVEPLQ